MKFSTAFPAFLRLRCPHCGVTPVFAGALRTRTIGGWFTTATGCPLCRYLFEREPGYFLMATWATGFLPTALFGIALMLFVLTKSGLGDAAQLALIMVPSALFALAIARHSRVLFLIIDHWFDPIAEDDHAAWRKAAGDGEASETPAGN